MKRTAFLMSILLAAVGLAWLISSRSEPPAAGDVAGYATGLVSRFFGHAQAASARAYQGYVEGDLLYVGPVEGERLTALKVEVGQEVSAGQTLFSMSTVMLEAHRNEQVARQAQAQSQLENLREAQQRPEQIAVLEAAVTRARAALTLSEGDYERQATLYPKGATTKTQLDQASAAMNRDAASLKEAQRQVIAAHLTGRDREIAGAESAVTVAQSQLNQIQTRIDRQTVAAPVAGAVQDVFFRPGEMVNTGQPVLAILPPANRKIRFYAPEPRMAGFALGREIAVSCDGCPPGITAKISFMSSQTEFTPPMIFSEEERTKFVYMLEARLENGANLPLGLPVTVRLLLAPKPDAS